MQGGNKASGDYYNLKDVPYPQYFNMTGESLHGTYWHDDFGHPHSHGCVNLEHPDVAVVLRLGHHRHYRVRSQLIHKAIQKEEAAQRPPLFV